MRIVFMGTSEFAVPALETLCRAGYEIAAVVTQPDRPQGRGNKPGFSAVKVKALELNLPVLQPFRLRQPEAIAELQELGPDLIIVASYGQLIPPLVLEMPRYGCLNIHASLLPRYRGAAPIHRAIMDGESETGVTIMLMDETLDTGDILSMARMPIEPNEDHGQVEEKLARLGAELLMTTIDEWIKGNIQPYKQDHTKSTYAAMIKSDEEMVDWTRDAIQISRQIRALSPSPGAYTLLDGRRLKLFSPRIVECSGYDDAIPGQIIEATANGLLLCTGRGCLSVMEAQREGKKRMPVAELIKGSGFKPGVILGD